MHPINTRIKNLESLLAQTEEALKKADAETELLLSSITSILIGLDKRDNMTYWNAISEATFGVQSAQLLNRPFRDCGIAWDLDLILKGIDQCRNENRTVRLDDVRMRRPNGHEGYLGLSIIPVRGERFDVLIFGADITDRKQLEQLKDEFISTVSHELRTPLAVIREGVSQVLDGILGNITENQRKFLTISLNAIDRLGRIINDLLDISKIEAEKLELKMDLVDLNALIHELIAPQSPFQLRANDRGLTLKGKLPDTRVEIYGSRDKLIQVLTNLIGNAMKFTETGQVEISLENKNDHIECSVTDTGRGISEEDITKLFTKFQQFGRVEGPGEKGTGLGLAICKGLIEMHRGKIWAQSTPGSGTTIAFCLPKPKTREIFRQYISSALRKAVQHRTSCSFILFRLDEKKTGPLQKDEVAVGVEHFEKVIKKSLRNRGDSAVRGENCVMVVLPSTNKEDAFHVPRRILTQYEQVSGAKFAFAFEVIGFPEDGKNDVDLINKMDEGRPEC